MSPAILARPASILAASTATRTYIAIIDSGTTHTLWPSHSAFISCRHVSNQYVTLADDSKIPILGKGAIAIKMGGKNLLIRDAYHVPGLRLPLYILHTHRRIQDCGFHSDNYGVCVFLPKFSIEVDNKIDSYVTCRSLGRTAKTFHYIQPRASPMSAAAGSVPRRRSP